jgi:hypothetical protein
VRSLERVEDHLERDDVLGEVLRLARALASGEEGASPSTALHLAPELFATRVDEKDLDDYLRALLQDGDAVLLDALLRSSDR